MVVVESLEEATQLALAFVRRYYSFAFPIAAKKEFSCWIVDLDISFLKPSYARVRLQAQTGAVEDFKVTLGQLL